nr:GTPase [uncultured Oscillibacter sp.]
MGVKQNYRKYRLADIKNNLDRAGFQPLDIMVTGVTGAGKSTTLNALFQKQVAVVGEGVAPETMDVSYYSLNKYFRIWDTPGLGDNVEKDRIHKEKIISLLKDTWETELHTYGFIDMALVLVEGINRDMGTTYTLLNEAIIPYIQSDRIFVAINQADVAMKNRHWDAVSNQPDTQLLQFLNEQAHSIQRRVWESTGVCIYLPVFYSAKYGYNIDKLLDFIIDYMPTERRKI